MLSASKRKLSRVAVVLLGIIGTATFAFADGSIQNGTAQPGDIICLAPDEVPVFHNLHVTGNAVDLNTLQPVSVKWVAFDNNTNIRLFKVVGPSVDAFTTGNGDHHYGCINNTSGVAVKFNLAQTVTPGP